MNSFQPNSSKPVPAEVRGWNWGAFFFTWFWGIFNNTWVAFISLVPIVHFVMAIVLGAKGNEWAWQNKEWDSIEHFHSVQRKWAIAALIVLSLVFAVFVVLPFGLIGWDVEANLPMFQREISEFSRPYQKFCHAAVNNVEQNQTASDMLGYPIALTGPASVARSRQRNVTEVEIPMKGSKGAGILYVLVMHGQNGAEHAAKAELVVNGQRHPFSISKADAELAKDRADLQLHHVIASRNNFGGRDPESETEAEQFYRESIAKLKNNAQIKELLGDNMSASVESASINQHGPMGMAEFKVAVKGNNNHGQMEVMGARSMGRWSLDSVVIQIPGKPALQVQL